MSQFAKPEYHFMNLDPFPFTNANFTGISCADDKSLLIQKPSPGNGFFDINLNKDTNDSLNTKKPLTKAERRAEHNAIERARRESLNTKFQSLAQALPNLINYRRPSKSQIVEKALDWIKQSTIREERYRYQVLQLQRENKNLLTQLMQQESPTAPVSATVPSLMRQQSTPVPSVSVVNTSCNANIPNIYTNLSTNDGWSIDNLKNYAVSIHQTTPSNSINKLSKQELNSKSDYEDDVSSGNKDDIEYETSECYPAYFGSESPQYQNDANHQTHLPLMATDIYSVGYQSNDTHFDPFNINTWNASKYSPSSLVMNTGNVDREIGSRSASVQMVS
ncbi:hypothetical protein [Parasitella parasitica]|uniref:BHLH domain-containing protein n=1 Tax=Parasitella parasitica TaxID=35722 RepID=A0A0B7N0C9_9FUNG|nr:hypothetical protein [Parasitella parasitica]